MRTVISAVSVILLMLLTGPAHSDNAKFEVLVDTDAACDDLRALCLLLATDLVDVAAVVSSDGALAPERGLEKVRALLESLGREDIPAAAGRSLSVAPPPWRSFCEKVPWGDTLASPTAAPPQAGIGAARLMIECLRNAGEPLTVVCLGPLTNLAEAMTLAPDIQSRIKGVLWYNDDISPLSGTNYERDSEAADLLFTADIPIDVIRNTGNDDLLFDEALLGKIDGLDARCAQRISSAHNHPDVFERVRDGHLGLWDDLVAVYLCHPELFDMAQLAGKPRHRINRSLNAAAVRKEMLDMLSGHGDHENVIFEEFPFDSALFKKDVRPHVREIIEKHGLEEWRLCVLASEMHRHLGIYSIVGAKMGLRAREILDAGPDELEVVSCAGPQPPLSCLNDGLQVSTGASLGHGTISVEADPEARPEAVFTRKGHTVRLRLKREYSDQTRNDIARGIEEYGNLTHPYFDFVRRLDIRYRLEWDRRKMFEVERQQ